MCSAKHIVQKIHLQSKNFLSCFNESEWQITRAINSMVKNATMTVSKSNLENETEKAHRADKDAKIETSRLS